MVVAESKRVLMTGSSLESVGTGTTVLRAEKMRSTKQPRRRRRGSVRLMGYLARNGENAGRGVNAFYRNCSLAREEIDTHLEHGCAARSLPDAGTFFPG